MTGTKTYMKAQIKAKYFLRLHSFPAFWADASYHVIDMIKQCTSNGSMIDSNVVKASFGWRTKNILVPV